MHRSCMTSNVWTRPHRMLAFASPLVALALGACVNPLLERPPAPTETRETRIIVPQSARNKVDILFVVDNSNSMEAMAAELRNRFEQFFTVFTELAAANTFADLHIGVITSDYGAGPMNGSVSGCGPLGGGQQGLLQSVGADAPTSCRPPLQVPYIQYQFDPAGSNNLPQSTRACTLDTDCPSGICIPDPSGGPGACSGTLDCTTSADCPANNDCINSTCVQNLVGTFTCMATVGTRGCGFEHVLESTRAALLNSANGEFLRPDAILTVVFLTNEDDCSAPETTDLFESNEDPTRYGYRVSYRCARFGLTCNGQLPPYGPSNGPLTCSPGGLSSNGQLFDVQRYIDFFTKPRSEGGIKDRPAEDVILVGIDPIPQGTNEPFNQAEIILSDPNTTVGVPYVPCNTLDPTTSPPCVPVVQHSCQNSSAPEFFGDPPIRLNTVINSAPLHNFASICDNDYTPALQGVGNLIANQIGVGCITARLDNPTDPDCRVEDVTVVDTTTSTVRPVERCSPTQGPPCWRLEQKSACAETSPDGLGLTIDRRGTTLPPNTSARISCVTLR